MNLQRPECLLARAKLDYRSIYDDLVYLDKSHLVIKDTQALIEEAHIKGTDFVSVTMKNKTDVIIPRRLEKDY